MGLSKKPYRILTLDGGGTFALIQAQALADLYPNQTGHEVLSHFDLVAGCSGGSVVASLLIENWSPQQIFTLFDTEKNRRALFGALPWHRSMIYHATKLVGNPVGHRFSTRGKLNFLHSVLPKMGKRPLHEIPDLLATERNRLRAARGEPQTDLAVMIVTYDFDRDRARMMRSHWQSLATNFPKHQNSSVHLADAVHASSTAPVNWFDLPAQFDHGRYWDGAMTGYNNPVLAGVSEAIASGVAAQDIGVLSIGTSAVSLPPNRDRLDQRVCQPKAKLGFVPSLVKVGKMIIADPPDAHTYLAHLMTGGRVPQSQQECPLTQTAVVRMNPLIQPVSQQGEPGRWGPPETWSVEDFVRLVKLDIAATAPNEVELIKRLCTGWMQGLWHNQAVRHGGQYPPAQAQDLPRYWEIGHRLYADAKQAWLGQIDPLAQSVSHG